VIVFDSLNHEQLVTILEKGGVGVLPTETIYGLAGRADSPDVVARITELKRGDGRYKPGTVIAASVDQLRSLGVDADTLGRVAHLWPNSLSIELPLSPTMEYLYQEGPHRAFRVIADPKLTALLEQTGPLITSSANIHGEPTANTVQEAQNYFGNHVDFYVDGGDLSGRQPSTVARLEGDRLVVVREGAVTIDEETGEIV
jgi:tRNA threonylcarbamoyl adenosine modification protein (Sua5/YciO/YrdC/YwlC family)